MSGLWAVGLLKASVSLISQVIVQKLIEDNIYARIKLEIVQSKIVHIVEETLQESFSSFPGFQEQVEGQVFVDYLSLPRVSSEIAKISHPTESPDIGALSEEWVEAFGEPLQGNVQLVVENFLRQLEARLWEVEEMYEMLHIKESHETLELLKEYLQLDSQLTYLTTVETRLEVAEADEKRTSQEVAYDARLDACRNLLKTNRPKASLDLLKQIEGEFTQITVSNELRFRLNTLMGACEYELGNEREAVVRFNAAHRLDPGSPKGMANAALAALVEDQIDDAMELASNSLQTEDGKDTSAPAMLAHAIARQHNFKDLDDMVEEEYLDNIAYVRALGNIFNQAKDYQKAEHYYRLCLAQDPDDFHCRLNLAQVIIDTKLTGHHPLFVSPLRIDPHLKDTIDEVEDLVDSAMEIAQRSDSQMYLWQALNARSVLRFIKGDLLAAKTDCDTILQDDPHNVNALHNRGLCSLLDQQHELAIEYFERLPLEYRLSDKSFFPLAKAYLDAGKPKDAIDFLDQFIEAGGNPDDLRVDVLRAWAEIREGNFDKANQIKDGLLKQNPENVDVLEAASFLEEMQNNRESSINYLEEAYKVCGEDRKNRERLVLRLATLHYFYRNFEQAVEWFNRLEIDFLDDHLLAKAYIQSLYSIQSYSEVYKTAKEVRERGFVDPTLIEIESWLAEYLGDIATALKLENLLVEIEPDRLSHRFQQARLEFLIGNKDAALDILEELDIGQISDPVQLMQIAEIYSFIGYPNTAIRIAYQARNNGLDNPEIHLAFSFLFLRNDDDLDGLHPEVVESNTAVLLVSSDAQRWIKILSIVEPREKDWEFSPDSIQGELLIGRRVGDTITFKPGQLEELEYEVRDIQSIYVRAFQETFAEFGTRFPDHPGLQKMQIVDQDFTKLFGVLIQRSRNVSQVFQLYEKGIITIGQVAQLIGRSPINIFTSLQGIRSQRIYASFGSEKDQAKQKAAIYDAKEVTLDLSALLSLAYLDSLPALTKRFDRIYISQKLLDEMQRNLAERYFELKKGGQSIGFQEGTLFFEEYAPAIIERNIQHIKGIFDFARDKFSVVSIPPDLAPHLKPPGELSHNVGILSINTILVARHTQTPMYADDARLRAFAEQHHKVQGFWSQVFLKDFEEKGFINHRVYSKACVDLISAGYFFTAVNKEVVLDVILANNYMMNENVFTVISGLKGPEATENKVIGIGAHVLKSVWLAPTTPEQRKLILDSVLRALCHERNRDIVIPKLAQVVRELLYMAPMHQSEVVREINLWRQVEQRRELL
jgi:tetratricopeptide (TPR) repeat protein